jgi:hypothetical protein
MLVPIDHFLGKGGSKLGNPKIGKIGEYET